MIDNALKGLTTLPQITIDHNEIVEIPPHKRINHVIKKYLSTGNIVEKTRIINYFSNAMFGIVGSVASPTVSMYLNTVKSGMALFELNTIFSNLIKIEDQEPEYFNRRDTMIEVIKDNFFDCDHVFSWDNESDQVKLIIQNISKTPKEIADKYELKILHKEETNDLYTEEAVIVAKLGDMLFAIYYELNNNINAYGHRAKDKYEFFLPWYTEEDNQEPNNRCIKIIETLSKMAIEVFCHRINPAENYVTIDKFGYQIHPKKHIHVNIRNIDYPDLVSSMEYCLEHNRKRGIAVVGEAGVGKGGRPTDKILTPTGWITYGEVKVGDTVIGSNGSPIKVTGVYPRGILETYKVTFSDNTTLTVDGDHLWKVQNNNQRYRGKGWVVKDTKFLASTVKRRWNIPMVEPIQTEHELTTKIDPYLLGVLLGDGYLGDTVISITKDNPELFVKVSEVLPVEVALSDITSENRTSTFSIVSTKGNSNVILEGIRYLGLSSTKSVDKFIPKEYLFSNVANRIKLLQGLMDTDGTVAKHSGCAQYSTSSEQLKDDFVYLVQSLGGTCTVSTKSPMYTYNGENKIGNISYVICICLSPDIIPFSVSVKKDIYKAPTKYSPIRVIRSIEKSEDSEIICISVDAEDHLYVTEHCIVTHNTQLIHKLIGHFKDVPTFIVRNEALLEVNSIRNVFNLVRDMKAIVVFDDFDGLDVQNKGPITNEFLHQMDVNGDFKGIIIATVNDPSKVHYTLISRPERFDEVLLMRSPDSVEEVEEVLLNKVSSLELTITPDEKYYEFLTYSVENKFTHARISSAVDYCLSHFKEVTGTRLLESAKIMVEFQKTSKMFSDNGELHHVDMKAVERKAAKRIV